MHTFASQPTGTPEQTGREILLRTRGLVVDIDGVLHVGLQPAPGLKRFLSFIEDRSIRLIYATNNSTLPPEALQDQLSSLGIPARSDQIITSATATATYLRKAFAPGETIMVVGEEGLTRAVEEAGFRLGNRGPAAVVVGLDRRIDYGKIQAAASALLAGIPFVACNLDAGAPSKDGIAPGAGAIVAAIQAVAQRPPIAIGKPEPAIFLEAVERMGLKPEESAAVGDHLEVDIVCARRAGLTGILVLTGMTSPEMLHSTPYPPDLVFSNVGELAARWEASLEG